MLIVRRTCVLALGLIAALTLASCNSYRAANDRTLPGVPRAVAAADFDGNGASDVMIGYGGDYWGVDIERSDAYGFFSLDHVSGTIPRSDLLAVTDFESDGVPDVVAGGEGTNKLDTLHNHGDASFAISSIAVAPAAELKSLTSGRASDGVNVVVAGYDDGGTPSIATWVGSGGQLQSRSAPSWNGGLTSASAIAVGDSDADGHLDLFVGGPGGTIRRYAGTGGAGAIFSANYTELTPYPGAGAVSALAVGDVRTSLADRDQRPDLIAGFDGSADVAEWQGVVGGFGAPQKLGEYEDTSVHTRAVTLLGTQWFALSNGIGALSGGDDYPNFNSVVTQNDVCSDGPASIALFPSMKPSDPLSRESIALTCFGDDPAAASVGKVNRLTVIFSGAGRLRMPAAKNFGSVAVGVDATQTAIVDAQDYAQLPNGGSQLRNIKIDGWEVVGADADQFSVLPVPSGSTLCPEEQAGNSACTADVTFAPTSPGVKQAALRVKNDAIRAPGAPMHSIPLTGTGVAPELTVADELDLGDIVNGHAREAQLTVKNSGSAKFDFGDLEISPAVDGWSVDSGDCGADLSVTSSCDLHVTYAPTETGRSSATLSIGGNQLGGPTLVDLDARSVVGALTAAPLDLHDVRVGTDHAGSVTFTNEDDGPVHPGAASIIGPDAARFSVASNGCAGLTLAVDSTCSVSVNVHSTARGPLMATLRLASDATTAPAEAPLTANGISGVAAAGAPVFAPLRAGFFAEKSVSIENQGDDDLKLGALRTEGPFSVSAACNEATIDAGGSCDVSVRFAPEALGENSGRLIIPNNGTTRQLAIALMGTGLEAESPPGNGSKPAEPPSFRLRLLKASAKRHSMFVGFTVSGGTTGLEGGRLKINLPAELRWYRMGKHRRIFDRLPRKVNLVIPRIAPGHSRGVAVRILGDDFLAQSFELRAKLQSGSGVVDSLRFKIGV
jgi:hypothetical protein